MKKYTVENVKYQKDEYGNIQMVKFTLKELEINYEMIVHELFVYEGEAVFAGFVPKGKTLDLYQLSYLYSIHHHKLYLASGHTLVRSKASKILKTIGIIIFLTLFFYTSILFASFLHDGEIFWQDRIDFLTSIESMLILGMIILTGVFFYFIDNNHFDLFGIQELKRIHTDEIVDYERHLEIFSDVPFFYDFNEKNKMMYSSGIVQKVDLQQKQPINKIGDYELYSSDVDERFFYILVDGITYYFESDYLDLNKGEVIEFYYSLNDKMIFAINTQEHLYFNIKIHLDFFKSEFHFAIKLIIYISLFLIIAFALISYFDESVGNVAPVAILIISILVLFFIGIMFISFLDFIFSKQFNFLKDVLSKNTFQLIYFLWNTNKYAVVMENDGKSMSCFHKK